MPPADRRHAIDVGRRFVERRPSATRAEMAGALLHDVGKVQSGLGTWGRVAATLVGGRTRRFRQYRDHEQIGAQMAAHSGFRPGHGGPHRWSRTGRRRPPSRRRQHLTAPLHLGKNRVIPTCGEESCQALTRFFPRRRDDRELPQMGVRRGPGRRPGRRDRGWPRPRSGLCRHPGAATPPTRHGRRAARWPARERDATPR